MAAINHRIEELLQAWTSRRTTPAEEDELFTLIREGAGQQELQEHITTLVEHYQPGDLLPSVEWELLYQRIREECQDEARGGTPALQVPRISTWKRWVVAASVVGLLLVTGYWLVYLQPSKNKTHKELVVIHDVPAPATNRAHITLADGQVIYLDSAGKGALVQQGAIQLVKLDNGKIVYSREPGESKQGVEVKNPAIAYNTLTNPRGSKAIDMALSDGTHVWLNAGSSVTYPVAFSGNERKVSIKGEAYFEVAHDPSKPFYVTKGEMEVKVLGTHFNVKAYEDEEVIRVTLLEGSVEVRSQESGVGSQSQKVRIKPGEQAVVSLKANQSTQINVQTPDLDAVMAWKNGRFQFSDASIEDILKEVSRYYDAEIVYKDKIPGHFVADISRNVSVSKVLRILELTREVHFKIEGKRITVMR